MHLERFQRWAMVLAWLTPGLWATNAIISRVAPGIIEPYTMAFGRWFLAGLVLVVLSWSDLRQHGREWVRRPWPYVALGFFGMFICGAWLYKAGRTTQAMNIGLIYATSPIMIMLASTWWLGERRLGPLQWAGVALALLGVLHVITGGQAWRVADIQWVEGDFWVLMCAISWSAYALVLRQTTSTLGDMGRLALINLTGAALLFPFAWVEWMDPATPAMGWTAWGLVILAALVPGIGSYLIFGWTQRVLGAARVSVTMYLGPLWSALLAWMLLGEQMGPQHWVGALMILPGIYLATRK